MAGKRLVDIAAVFNAAQGVAQKHVALKARQLDVYNRTSTLAKAVRNQTDRVTETAKAASFLASRFSESAPPWAAEDTAETSNEHLRNGGPRPSKRFPEGGEPGWKLKGGLEQDQYDDKSKRNSATDRLPKKDSDIQQEKADHYPLSGGAVPPSNSSINIPPTRPENEPIREFLDKDGFDPLSSSAPTNSIPSSRQLSSEEAKTVQRQLKLRIPSKTADSIDDPGLDGLEESQDEDSFIRASGQTSSALSSSPRVKISKHPSNSQGGESSLSEGGIAPDSFYTPGQKFVSKAERIPSVVTIPEQGQIPEGINTDVFYSLRVARILGGKTRGSTKNDLELKVVAGTPVGNTNLAADNAHDTFNVRMSSQSDPEFPRGVSKRFGISKGDTEQISNETTKETRSNLIDIVAERNIPCAVPYELRESKVPSSRLGRLWNYGSLAAGLFGGAISESLRRVSGNGGEGSYMLSASNMDRLVSKLSRMRGAALKLGQMLSFQDSKIFPAAIQEVLQRVQDRADYMPPSQRNKVLAANLGPNWGELFSTFEEKPLAAASIGQVHRATLRSTGDQVAVKVQYPGVADSIDSDLDNLSILLTASRLLPKGLFLDKTIANARIELGWECDYMREAECGRRFQDLLSDETDVFVVPKVYPEASGKQVLTMEYMNGIGVTRTQSFSQAQKDWIGTQILRLCLREITEFKFMQTDPNWTNFLFNAETNRLELLDFGASREYPQEFITKYTSLLEAASRSDKDTVRELSIELGYLTGHESRAMLKAHVASVLTLAEPFLASSPEVYDFRDQTITDRVQELIPVMIRERLAPPPEETYSLHRKLSGAFLLCARLGSRVRCRELFESSMKKSGLATNVQ